MSSELPFALCPIGNGLLQPAIYHEKQKRQKYILIKMQIHIIIVEYIVGIDLEKFVLVVLEMPGDEGGCIAIVRRS